MATQEKDLAHDGSMTQKSQPESDAKKLADKHLADPNHVITDEDLAKIRVGVVSEADTPTEDAVDDAGDRIADRKSDDEEETTPGAQKSTPWDVLES